MSALMSASAQRAHFTMNSHYTSSQHCLLARLSAYLCLLPPAAAVDSSPPKLTNARLHCETTLSLPPTAIDCSDSIAPSFSSCSLFAPVNKACVKGMAKRRCERGTRTVH